MDLVLRLLSLNLFDHVCVIFTWPCAIAILVTLTLGRYNGNTSQANSATLIYIVNQRQSPAGSKTFDHETRNDSQFHSTEKRLWFTWITKQWVWKPHGEYEQTNFRVNKNRHKIKHQIPLRDSSLVSIVSKFFWRFFSTVRYRRYTSWNICLLYKGSVWGVPNTDLFKEHVAWGIFCLVSE